MFKTYINVSLLVRLDIPPNISPPMLNQTMFIKPFPSPYSPPPPKKKKKL